MPLLHDEDYDLLAERGIAYEEELSSRFLVLKRYPLPRGIYNVDHCDVIVVIPHNYNASGNDMFWTYPALSRRDKKPIPNINPPGGGDNRQYDGREFCRWSRHWNGSSAWRPHIDNILTILQRIEWAFTNPDANQ